MRPSAARGSSVGSPVTDRPKSSVPSACQGGAIPVSVPAVKGIQATLFFVLWTVVGAAGVVVAVAGKGPWLLIATFVVYLGILIKWGCLADAH